MTNEVNNLELLTNSPKKPFSVILGGAKISDKLQLINNLLPSVDNLLNRWRHVLHIPKSTW